MLQMPNSNPVKPNPVTPPYFKVEGQRVYSHLTLPLCLGGQQISTPEIDALVEIIDAVLKGRGGVRLTGAGFGGSVLRPLRPHWILSSGGLACTVSWSLRSSPACCRLMRSWMTAAGLLLYPLQVVCLTPDALVPDIKQAVEDLYPSRSGLLPPSPQHHETLNSSCLSFSWTHGRAHACLTPVLGKPCERFAPCERFDCCA